MSKPGILVSRLGLFINKPGLLVSKRGRLQNRLGRYMADATGWRIDALVLLFEFAISLAVEP